MNYGSDTIEKYQPITPILTVGQETSVLSAEEHEKIYGTPKKENIVFWALEKTGF